MCSGQSRTRCLFLIIFVVIEPPVAVDEFLDELRLLSWLPDRPLGAGESARSADLPRPPPLALGAGVAFGPAFGVAFGATFFLGLGSGAGAALGVGIVPSLNGGGVNLSFAALGRLSKCL